MSTAKELTPEEKAIAAEVDKGFGENVTEAIGSGKYLSIVAFVDEKKRVQYRCHIREFPLGDTGKVVARLKEFVLRQISMPSSRSEL